MAAATCRRRRHLPTARREREEEQLGMPSTYQLEFEANTRPREHPTGSLKVHNRSAATACHKIAADCNYGTVRNEQSGAASCL